MPTYVFGLLLFITPEFYRPLNEQQTLNIIYRLSVVTVLLPALSIGILKFTGYIGSIHLSERNERFVPYLFTCLYYGVMTYIFYQGMSFHPFYVLMSSITILILVLTFVNLFIKVSAHACSIMGIIGFLSALKLNDPEFTMLFPLAGIIFLSGVIMMARLQLNAHKPSEVYSGAVIGYIICFCGVFLLL